MTRFEVMLVQRDGVPHELGSSIGLGSALKHRDAERARLRSRLPFRSFLVFVWDVQDGERGMVDWPDDLCDVEMVGGDHVCGAFNRVDRVRDLLILDDVYGGRELADEIHLDVDRIIDIRKRSE